MTPKEAIEKIEAHVNCYSVDKVDYAPYFQNVKQALTELEAIKRYPTSEEVCKALSENYKYPVIFDNDTKEFIVTMTHPIIMQYSITEHKNGCVRVQIDYLKPHLITLIGRFYEGLEKVGKEE